MQLLYHWFWYLLPGNPLFVRVLESGSRRKTHLGYRMAYLGVLTLLMIFGLLSGNSMGGQISMSQLAKTGTTIFAVTAYGQVILITLLAPLFMSAAIASERSGQTFNILITTPLTNLQIVLGSLLGRLFFVWALLLSGLPLFSVLLIFGGVPTSAVFISFTVAALSALTVGSMAIALSVARTGGRKAVFIFVFSVAGYLIAAYAFDFLLLRRAPLVPNGTTWLTGLHPLLVLDASFKTAIYRPPLPEEVASYPALVRFYLTRPFAAFCTICLLTSLLLNIWSATQVRRAGQGESALMAKLRKLLHLPAAGAERRHAPRPVWANPIAWREAVTRGRGLANIIGRWTFAVAAFLVGAALLVFYHLGKFPAIKDPSGATLAQDVIFRNALLTLLLLEVGVIIMVALFMSAGCVSREREDGTLDLLLTTPITPKYYVWGKLRGLVSFLGLLIAVPVLTLFLVSAYSVVGGFLNWPQARVNISSGGAAGNVPLMLAEAPLLLLLTLLPFVAFCVIVGVGFSLNTKGVLGAVVKALGVIAVIAAVLAPCGWSLAEHVPILGPAVNAYSPATNLIMIISPWERIGGFMQDPEPYIYQRLTLFICCILAAGGYSLGVSIWLNSMVKNFDTTVRKLTGTT